jgi:hypothetical protein
MKEGAWIHATTQAYAWIDEHARWIHQRANAASLGLPEEVLSRLEAIPPDHDGPGRRSLLLIAMDAGLIRFRGHGAHCALESTCPWVDILRGAAPFLEAHMGPYMQVRIHDLVRQEELSAPWWVLQHTLEINHPEELQPMVQPCHMRAPRVSSTKPPRSTGNPGDKAIVASPEDVMPQALRNHPGLTPEEFLEMSRCLGF